MAARGDRSLRARLAAPSCASPASCSPRLRTLFLLLAASTALSGTAFAEPQGGHVVAGSARIDRSENHNVTVNQWSQNAIINWSTFNVGTNERVRFDQPNSSAAILNRVTGGRGPSEILGALDANGKVFLVNRAGIVFGQGATINTGGFLATTSDIANYDFMRGRYKFDHPGKWDASIVVNKGATITAANGGFAALVAPTVRNSGTITADLGTIVLG